MKIRDISLKKRLLIGNFLMVLIPIILLTIMGWLIFTAMRFVDNGQKSALMSTFFQDKGSALSIEFAVSSIKSNAEHGDKLKLRRLISDCQILEGQGMSAVIMQDGKILYSTPNINPAEVTRKIFRRKNPSPSILIWDSKGFVFKYTSQKHGAVIMAVGNIPLDAKGEYPPFSLKDFLEIIGAIFVICAGIFLILLGRYLSKLLSRQILEPLEKLREVAEKIREGNLDVELKVDAQDEVGETCRDFDKMRRELKANKELQEKYELNRKELIAGISHDLATPITALKGYASGILDGVAKTPEKKFHYVEMMNKTVSDMEKLVDSLFFFSKLDLGRIEFNLETVNLAEYFSDFIADKQEIFNQRGLTINLENKITRAVKIDYLQFARLVENILENSIKYRRGDFAKVNINLVDEGKFLRVSFADNGRGVSDEELPKIFDIFYRTDPARTKVAKGSGLGLAVVKQIALGMNGEIWAEHTEGGGLTIVLRLPIEESL